MPHMPSGLNRKVTRHDTTTTVHTSSSSKLPEGPGIPGAVSRPIKASISASTSFRLSIKRSASSLGLLCVIVYGLSGTESDKNQLPMKV